MKSHKNNSIIHIHLKGGLGNQLFQYSMGLYLSKFFNKRVLYLDQGLMQEPLSKELQKLPNSPNEFDFKTKRNYMLGDLIDSNSKSNLTRAQFILIRWLSFLFPALFVIEYTPPDLTEFRITESTKILVGYFQRHDYVCAMKTELLSAFKKSTLFAGLIPSVSNSDIAVHVRYGDYSRSPHTKHHHGLTAIEYYVQAVQILLNSSEKFQKIVIYSDESQRAFKEFVKEFGGCDIPIVTSGVSNEYDDLRGISHSKGIVISNSTFSWWAAWIGHHSIGSHVVAPKPWLAKPSVFDKNLIPDGWTVLDRKIQP